VRLRPTLRPVEHFQLPVSFPLFLLVFVVNLLSLLHGNFDLAVPVHDELQKLLKPDL
jgi:hypothetical protein